MDQRKLVFGLAVLLIIAGLLLALFAPGGLFNSRATETVQTPLGSLSVSSEKSSPWPIVGYVLLGLGGLTAVVAFAMKSPPRV